MPDVHGQPQQRPFILNNIQEIDELSLEIMRFADTDEGKKVLEESPAKGLSEYNTVLLKTVLRHSTWECTEDNAVMKVGTIVADLMPIHDLAMGIIFLAYAVTKKEPKITYPASIRNHM